MTAPGAIIIPLRCGNPQLGPLLDLSERENSCPLMRGRPGMCVVAKRVEKRDLPVKVCLACNRPFVWRKKWAKVWDEVKYCSDA